MARPFRWGILGTARINLRRLPGFRQAGHTIAIVGSRDTERGRAHAAELGAERSGTYEDVIAATDLDGVYISLPNTLHVPWTVRAADAGKQILCEKPLSPSVAGCHEMVAAAERNGVKLVEAFMYRNHPVWEPIWNTVRSGKIGKIEMVRASFGFFLDRPGDIRISRELGGGATQDVGCYTVNAVRWFLGEPVRVRGVALDRRGVGVDTHGAAVMEYESGALGIVECTLDCNLGQHLEILGTSGRIELESPFTQAGDLTVRTFGAGGETRTVVPAAFNYGLEFAAFERHVRDGAATLTPASDAVGTQAVIAAWRAAGERGVVSLSEVL